MSREARRLVITGQVQGIGYRWSMAAAAEEIGVTGWVRNRRDGSVEATVCGAGEAIARIIVWAQRGPPGARVDHVAIEPAETEDFAGFAQQPTA